MRDTYYEKKKASGLIFTANNIDPSFDNMATMTIDSETYLIDSPIGVSYWSKKFHRYRTAYEQKAFVGNGCKE